MADEASGVGKKAEVRSEDELGIKWDRCVADTIIKTGAGLGLGLVFSLLLFKRRLWPVALGTGYGLGYAMANCQHDFSRVPTPFLQPVSVPFQPPPPLPSPEQKEETTPTNSDN